MVSLNPGDHPVDGFDGDWETFCPSTNVVNFIQVSGPNPADPPWSCTLDSSGDCNAPPTICIWGGVNTTCSLNSQIDSNGLWSGTMEAGVDGALPGVPGGQSIVLSFTSS
jgi:hypothetical protein